MAFYLPAPICILKWECVHSNYILLPSHLLMSRKEYREPKQTVLKTESYMKGVLGI